MLQPDQQSLVRWGVDVPPMSEVHAVTHANRQLLARRGTGFAFLQGEREYGRALPNALRDAISQLGRMDSGLQHEFVRVGGSDRVRKQSAFLQHRRMIRLQNERLAPMSTCLEATPNLLLAHRWRSRAINASTLLGGSLANTLITLARPSR